MPRTEKQRSQTRHWKLKTWYGLTPENYGLLLAKQKNCCALCGESLESRRIVVDHCHRTQVVRGLLHIECNSMIGAGGDDPVRLKQGMEYLIRTTPPDAHHFERQPHPVSKYDKQPEAVIESDGTIQLTLL